MDSQISTIFIEYKVRTITGDEFKVIYTANATKVAECLCRNKAMFEKSNFWVAGLDVEYTTAKGKEKYMKENEKARAAVIQICLDNFCLIYHICHTDMHCQSFENSLKDKQVRFIGNGTENDKKVLQ